MKKYIIIALCTITTASGMEQQIVKREPREWPAQEYDNGNTLQTTTFLNFLKTNNIQIKDKFILSVGCGTGKIENILAKDAQWIHGFDASKNMIDFAQDKHGKVENLSFEHCFAEDFQSPLNYQLAIASFCLHWVEHKKQAFQRINENLELHGELFGTVQTSDNPTPTNLIVAQEMMPLFQETVKSVTNQELPELNNKTMQAIIGSSYPSHEEFNTMLRETGFEIIKSKEEWYTCTMNRDELTNLQRPIFSSRPLIKDLPGEIKEKLFIEFITRYINKLEKIGEDSFLDKHSTTIIHARKIKK